MGSSLGTEVLKSKVLLKARANTRQNEDPELTYRISMWGDAESITTSQHIQTHAAEWRETKKVIYAKSKIGPNLSLWHWKCSLGTRSWVRATGWENWDRTVEGQKKQGTEGVIWDKGTQNSFTSLTTNVVQQQRHHRNRRWKDHPHKWLLTCTASDISLVAPVLRK